MAEIRAEMAGSVWRVLVKEGEAVSAGADVVILESMKMEIPHPSLIDGIVTRVTVAEGDTVQEDDLLVVIE
ncbi:MAG: biotin/lipoyl-binding carrier protein [Chloroflexota bacterium]